MFHIRRNIKYYNYRPHLIVETNLKFDSKFPHNKTKQKKTNIVTRSLSPYLTCVFGAFHYNSPGTFTLFIARVHWILEMMFIIIDISSFYPTQLIISTRSQKERERKGTRTFFFHERMASNETRSTVENANTAACAPL